MSSAGTASSVQEVDAARVERFRRLLRLPTVSHRNPDHTDWAPFAEFVALLPALYPALHAVISREVVAGHSLLYRWPGRSSEAPTVLLAHYDVVPAAENGWASPPFAAELSGEGAAQILTGRGTLDDKGALAAILEAVEDLVLAGFTPERDVYLSFGHDEEVASVGAATIARLLDSRGVRPALVLDEGGAIVEPGSVPGVDCALAVVGVTEKGITSLRLSVEQSGGHASTPPRITAPVRLARAIARLSRARFPARMSPAATAFVSAIAPHASGVQRLLFERIRFTRPLVARLFAGLTDETRAMVCTTAAVTQLTAGEGGNVLAERASAILNVRVAVGSSVGEAVAQIRRAVRDPSVAIEVLSLSEPSPVSPASGPEWDAISDAAAAVAPEAVVTPYTMLAASDSRFFTGLCAAVYRFTPFRMSAEDRATLHAGDERIATANWLGGIAFYTRLLRGR
jgi:carboxypeptidase PM20D1